MLLMLLLLLMLLMLLMLKLTLTALSILLHTTIVNRFPQSLSSVHLPVLPIPPIPPPLITHVTLTRSKQAFCHISTSLRPRLARHPPPLLQLLLCFPLPPPSLCPTPLPPRLPQQHQHQHQRQHQRQYQHQLRSQRHPSTPIFPSCRDRGQEVLGRDRGQEVLGRTILFHMFGGAVQWLQGRGCLLHLIMTSLRLLPLMPLVPCRRRHRRRQQRLQGVHRLCECAVYVVARALPMLLLI